VLPPGQYLLYWTPNNTRAGTIYAVPLDGSSRLCIADEIAMPDSLSPDLTQAVFGTGVSPNPLNLTIMSLGDRTETVVPNAENCQHASWAPDGQSLAAQCQNDIWILPLKGGEPIRITDWAQAGKYSVDFPLWSPDGQWIAYLNRPLPMAWGEENGLYVVDTLCLPGREDCQPKTLAPFTDVRHYAFGWSPDSNALVVYGNKSISLLNIWMGEYQKLVEFQGEDLPPEDMAWSLDGERIAYDKSGVIYVVSVRSGEILFQIDSPFYTEILAWVAIPQPFVPGDLYTITQAGANLNLRDAPTLNGNILKKLQPGDTVFVIAGPQWADGYDWWQMHTQDGVEGWAVDIPDWYAP
jgi:dipeptidyl aminopeptidase/acylaminoacyl peptidase